MRDFSKDHYYVVSLPGLVPGFHLVGGVRFEPGLEPSLQDGETAAFQHFGAKYIARVKDHPDQLTMGPMTCCFLFSGFLFGGNRQVSNDPMKQQVKIGPFYHVISC